MSYKSTGPVNCDVDVDTSNLKGKTVVVTGGSNGMGYAYLRAFTKAGAYVVSGDITEGDAASAYDGKTAKFVKCDVTKWSDQLALFKEALALSPKGRVDIVIANAGISGADKVFFNDVEREEPEEPDLKIININLIGVLYTTKLALHYFRRQAAKDKENSQDQVLILQGSLAGYLDLAGTPQYSASKFGLRGMMRTLRTTEGAHNTRVNYIGPWFVATKILSTEVWKAIQSQGIPFAEEEDAAGAVLRIVTDPSINGRAFAILPRVWAPRGYADVDVDDAKEGLVRMLQEHVTKTTYRATTKPELQ